jgi:hypothetical protein
MMSEVVARLGGEGRALEHRVFECFAGMLGEGLRDRAEAEGLRGTTLFVRVSSAALAHELVLLRRSILDRIAAEVGPGRVTELRTKIGEVG